MHENRRNLRMIAWSLFGLGLIAWAGSLGASTQAADNPAAEKKPLTIKQVMKEAHKKPILLLKKVAMGKATSKQKDRLLELYQALAKAKPPKGELKGWKEKCGLLVTAAKSAIDGKPEAKKLLEKASNCKGCHKLYK